MNVCMKFGIRGVGQVTLGRLCEFVKARTHEDKKETVSVGMDGGKVVVSLDSRFRKGDLSFMLEEAFYVGYVVGFLEEQGFDVFSQEVE